MKVNKYLKIILVMLALITCFFYGKYFLIPDMQNKKNCPGFDRKSLDFVKCYGLISIHDGWDIDYLYIKDNVNKYELAEIDNLNQYIVIDKNIYLINKNPVYSTGYKGAEKQYTQKFFRNGILNYKSYKSIEDMPKYTVVNYETGEVVLYKNIEEVPEAEKQYFEKLLNL